MNRILGVVVCLLMLTGCAGASFNVFEEKEAVKPFYPPLPPPIVPVNPDPIIATPDLTEIWNAEVEEGTRPPYVVYGFDANTWLSMKQYEDRKDYYIRNLLEILKWMGHPALQDEEKKE